MNRQRAAAVAALAEVYYKEGKIQTAEEHEPEYLRKSQAERERAERESVKHADVLKNRKTERRANDHNPGNADRRSGAGDAD